MDSLVLNSPAKINIGLNVINKRNDGFHNIETVFYPLILSDTLNFKRSKETIFTSNSEEISKLENNLILRAKDLLEAHFKRDLPVNIYLDKKIPIGGGLGGGSSNAAVTLKALCNLFSLEISLPELKTLALEIGSDVPYFLNPVPSFATSRGENLKSVALSISQPILIVNPNIHISTKWAFSKTEIENKKNNLEQLCNMEIISINDIRRFAKNDFEEIIFKKYPEIMDIKEKLISFGADYSSMSGTGSTVYGIFSNLQNARNAESYLKTRNFAYLNYPVNQGSIT